MNPLEKLANAFREPWHGQDELVFEFNEHVDSLVVTCEVDESGPTFRLAKSKDNFTYAYSLVSAIRAVKQYLPDRPFVPSDPLRD